MSMNVWFGIGRVVRQPEVRCVPSGDAVAEFSIAISERKKGTDGSTRETGASFFDVAVWGKSAESCGKHLDKGDLVAVQGKLLQKRWESRDGQKRSKVVVRAYQVEFLRVAAWGQGGASGAGESQETGYRPEDEDQSRSGDVQEQGEYRAEDQNDLAF